MSGLISNIADATLSLREMGPGMPGVAIGLGGATHVLGPEEIASLLAQWVR